MYFLPLLAVHLSVCYAEEPLDRYIVNTSVLPSSKRGELASLSESEFTSVQEADDFIVLKSDRWVARISEEYLPIKRMRALERFHRLLALEADGIIDQESHPQVLAGFKEMLGGLGSPQIAELTKAPDFWVYMSPETTLHFQRGDDEIRVALPNQDTAAEEKKPITTPDARATKPEASSKPWTHFLFPTVYEDLPCCLQVVSAAKRGVPDKSFTEILEKVDMIRIEQQLRNREAYLEYQGWVRSQTSAITKELGEAKSFDGLSKNLQELVKTQAVSNWKASGFGSPEEAEKFFASSPRLLRTSTKNFVGYWETGAGGNTTGGRIFMDHRWLESPPQP